MFSLPVISKALQIIAGIGVAKVATTVLDNTVKSVGAGPITRAAHWTGGLVLTSMVYEQAQLHVDRVVKTFAEDIKKAQKKAEEEAAKK